MPWRRRRRKDDEEEPRQQPRRDLADLDAGAGGPGLGDIRPARSDVTVRDDTGPSEPAPWPPQEPPPVPEPPPEQPPVFDRDAEEPSGESAPEPDTTATDVEEPAAPQATGAAPPGPSTRIFPPARLPGDGVLDPEAVARAARTAVHAALEEDLGALGDLTTLATVPPDAHGEAFLVARADGVLAGADLVALVYDRVDPRVEVELHVRDGGVVWPGDVLGTVRGPLRSLLTGERTALNFLTHLSGVATRTRQFVDAVAGTGCVIRDTRKTLPGLRLLEKAAVRVAGGANHRIGLSDALLVKDNHVAAAGSVAAATRAALGGAMDRHVQVEVTSQPELLEAIDAGARDVLLDNFTPDEVRAAVEVVRGLELDERVLLEASGTIRLDNVRGYAEAGVDRVAIGGITHSAPQLDIALDVQTGTPGE